MNIYIYKKKLITLFFDWYEIVVLSRNGGCYVGDEKSPRHDGYSFLFFKKSWEVIGEDFYATVHDFFVCGKLLKQINHSIITLVPKSASVTSANDFRPISICNVV